MNSKNILRALYAGLLAFVIQIGAANIINGVALPLLMLASFGDWFNYVWQAGMGLLLGAIVYFVARWYFKTESADCMKGAYLGVTMMVVGALLVIAQILPALAYGEDVLSGAITYFTGMEFIMTAVITVAGATLAGYTSRKTVNCDVKDAVSACMPAELMQ